MHIVGSTGAPRDSQQASSTSLSTAGKSFADVLQDVKDADANRHKSGLAAPVMSEAQQALQDWLSVPLDERIFQSLLQSLGITKEEYAAMSPEEKMEIAAKVRERLEEQARDAREPDSESV